MDVFNQTCFLKENLLNQVNRGMFVELKKNHSREIFFTQ
jgi:hypothetical protein